MLEGQSITCRTWARTESTEPELHKENGNDCIAGARGWVYGIGAMKITANQGHNNRSVEVVISTTESCLSGPGYGMFVHECVWDKPRVTHSWWDTLIHCEYRVWGVYPALSKQSAYCDNIDTCIMLRIVRLCHRISVY